MQEQHKTMSPVMTCLRRTQIKHKLADNEDSARETEQLDDKVDRSELDSKNMNDEEDNKIEGAAVVNVAYHTGMEDAEKDENAVEPDKLVEWTDEGKITMQQHQTN
jgi:hypothetical protein